MKGEKIFLGVLFVFGFFSCSNIGSKDVKIGFLIHSSANIRWKTDIQYLTNKAEELGATFILRDAGGDENVQLKQAHELLEEEGVDVLIVVAANQNTAGGIVREAHEYNVPVISYDRMIKNADVDYLLSFEYEKVGERMVEYIAERAPGGNCIVLWGDPNDANAVFIKRGQERVLNALSGDQKLQVIYRSYVEDWNDKTAETIVSEVLNFSTTKVDAIIASNIPLAMGALRSLKSLGYQPEEVLVTAMDASIEFIHSMLEGGITMTVTKPIQDLANGAMTLAVDLARKRNPGTFSTTVYNGRIDVPAMLFPPTVIDRSNFEQELIDKGFFSKEEVYSKGL